MTRAESDAPANGHSFAENGNASSLPRPNKELRFAISFGLGLVVSIGAVVGGMVGCLVFLWWWPDVANVPRTAINLSDSLNFAGVMITILAFVSAFYILVVAIDAFKISSDIAENRRFIDDNRFSLEELKVGLKDEHDRLAGLQHEAEKIRNEAQLSTEILQEINTAEEDTRKMLRRFERTHSALAAICDVLIRDDSKNARKAKAYTAKVGENLSELIDDNEHRRARIVLLASMVSGNLPGGVRVEDYHVQAVRAEAEGDGPHSQRAEAVLAKYSAWLALRDADPMPADPIK